MKFLFKIFVDMKIPTNVIKEFVKAVLYLLAGWLGGDYIS